MHPRSLHRDLFSHNDWGWHKIFSLAEGLSQAQLDEPIEMGLGSFRATLDHICQAERLWLDRWQNKPWAALPPPDPRASLADLSRMFRDTAAERDAFFDQANAAQPIHYRNNARHPFTHKLGDLALHVANHGVHHRAQALNMLRRAGVPVPNLDYLFFRLEQPTVELGLDTIERFASAVSWLRRNSPSPALRHANRPLLLRLQRLGHAQDPRFGRGPERRQARSAL